MRAPRPERPADPRAGRAIGAPPARAIDARPGRAIGARPERAIGATRLLVAFALCHVVIATWPGIDIAVARLFHSPEAGFGLARSAALDRLRHAIWGLAVAVALTGPLAWLAFAALGGRARVRARLWAYPSLLLLIGPGILVNGLLKAHWGRARPADIEAFGGAHPFTPPFQMAGPCARNCAFVSGEGAGAVALAIGLAAILPASPWVRASLAALALAGSSLRVATGRHFLSDAVFAAFLVAFLAMALHRLMRIAPARGTLTRANLAHDAALIARAVSRGGTLLARAVSRGGTLLARALARGGALLARALARGGAEIAGRLRRLAARRA